MKDEDDLQAIEDVRYAIWQVRVEERGIRRHSTYDTPQDEGKHEAQGQGDGYDGKEHGQVRPLHQFEDFVNQDQGICEKKSSKNGTENQDTQLFLM